MSLPALRSSPRRGASLACLLLVALLAPPLAARAADVRLHVAGASPSGEVKLRVPTEDFQRVLRVDLLPGTLPDGGVDEVLPGGVTVLVDPLTSTEGVQVALDASVRESPDGGATAELSTRQPVHVVLSGRLPAAGEYTGALVLVREGARETTPLAVSRVLAAPTVQFAAPAPAVASNRIFRTEARVRLPFKETGGVEGTLSAPTLFQLHLQGADTGTGAVQSRVRRATFSLEGALPDGGSLPVSELPEGIPVARYGSGALLLDLEGLDGPGEYSGIVRLAVKHGVAVEQPFTLWVRTPWGWGALLIALGALSSYGVRLYVQHIRPRAVRLQRAQELRRRIQALVSAHPEVPERTVGEDVRAQVDVLIADIERPVRGVSVGDAELAALEPRLRLYESWCDTQQRARELGSLLSKEARERLDAVGQKLADASTTPEQLTEEARVLRELDVVALARAALESRWQELEKQARALAQQLGGENRLGFRLTYELLPQLERVRELLPRDLEEARQQLELARRSYFDILCAELSAAIASDALPRGFTADEWNALRAEVREKLRQARLLADSDLDAAFRLYQEAHATYVRQLILELRGAVEEAARTVATTEVEQKALEGIGSKLREAMGQLAREAPHEAAATYEQARDAFTQYERPLRVAAGRVGGVLEAFPAGEGVPAPPAPASAPVGGSLPEMPATLEGMPVLGDLGGLPLPGPQRMWAIELGVLLLLTGVAVALGLQLLNVFSPTWGGFGAGMTAFLWGFGMHQVGNATFEGLTGLWSKMGR